MTNRWAAVVFAISMAVFGCFFIYPLFATVKGGFSNGDGSFTGTYFREAFINPIYLQSLLNSLAIAFLTTISALALALPLSFFSCRYEFPLKKTLTALVLVPMILPPFVGAIGITKIFGLHGILNALLIKFGLLENGSAIDWLGKYKFGSIVFFEALNLYPILFLNISAALANVDPSMEEAAASLGCTGVRRFFKITLPLTQSGVFAGLTIVFIWSFTELGTPLVFNYDRVLPAQIFGMLKELGSNPFPYALASVVLLLSAASYLLGKKVWGQEGTPMLAKATHGSTFRTLGVGRKIFCSTFFAIVVTLSVLPHVVVIILSFTKDWFGSLFPTALTLKNFSAALGHPLAVSAIKNSLTYAGMATIGAVIFGMLLALVIARSKFPGRSLLDTLSMLPLAVPGIIIAFGYLVISQRGQPLARLNPIENPTLLLTVAYGIRKLPFMVRAAVAGLQQTSVTYEEAAAGLGSKPFNTYCRITVPLIFGNLIAGAILVFSQIMLEVSDSLIIAQKQQFYPITKAIYELLNLLGDGPYLACAMGVWCMLFLAITIFGASALMGKKMGTIFRA
ncbi:MAG: iron ABC transporter permease [Puniceicoccales bacterium]|jgi:iron(III) transport system permease protein|nr:iron ABC transporter permease [Puniceicoccales bacterium]